MTLPKPVKDAVREGRAFLFLGAGASIGATHPKLINPPNGQELAEKIAEKFLDPQFKKYSLAQVSELAISEHDLLTVQEFIASLFYDFCPADFHKLLPKFVWRGIATTNYDLIVERSYDAVEAALQHLVVFKKDGERIEERLRSPKSVMFLKLHGCITNIDDIDTPLILTPDQYISHKKGRTRLFERLQNFAYEYPFIFIGYNLSDIDIRAILHEIDQLGDTKPRSYIVTPNMTPTEVKFWEGRKITHLNMSFKEFLYELDSSIPSSFRSLSTVSDKSEHPIYKRFVTTQLEAITQSALFEKESLPATSSPEKGIDVVMVTALAEEQDAVLGKFPDNQKLPLQEFKTPKKAEISESLITFLNRDVEYIHSGYKTERADPKAFYKGYFVDWSPIVSNLDVKRSLTDSILSEVFLSSEEERREICEFFVLKGHAGSGKSVILKRLAWEASVEFDKLCLFTKQISIIDFEPISELYRLVKERIFLFVDPVTEFSEVIDEIIPKARREKIPLTIIGAERQNEWNISCDHLDVYITGTYDLPYLNENEIEGLIQLLTKHHSLGYLQDKTLDEQKEALGKLAGRQLLVALHEATLGKPFSDIVLDEYKSISSRRAQSLYLTVCIFHRLRVPVRAGLISRVHGIPFTEFSKELFKPLEYIVFARMNELIHDFEYSTRHSHIAEIVFERVLVDAQDRFDEYMRVIKAIDIDYSADKEAFKGITNARELLSLFRDPQMIRQIYTAARNRDGNNPMLFQQEAIFEMHSPNGSLEKASELLQKAFKLAPYNKAIAHSLSELALRKADNSSNDVEKHKYFRESKKIAQGLISKGSYTAHPYHTLIKVEISELEELITTNDETNIERKIKDLEKNISTVVQLFPEDSYIRAIEAHFCDLINKHAQALNALEKAFANNKRNSYIALRLAKVYDVNGRLEDAIKVLKECLEANPSEKHANFHVAMLIQKSQKSNKAEIRHYLRRSFTTGDNNYVAQFWYARFLYLDGERDDAMELFRRLGDINIDNQIKMEPRGTVTENGIPKRFAGIVSKVEASFAFIIRDTFQDEIFTHFKYHEEKEWEKLSYHKRVTFDLAFTYRGPIALLILLE